MAVDSSAQNDEKMARDPLAIAAERLNASSDSAAQTYDALRALKTVLIGNKARKLVYAADTSSLTRLARLLSGSSSETLSIQNRAQAATILGVLSLPNEAVLLNLLLADVPAALWRALREITSSGKVLVSPERGIRELLIAILRALKSFYAALIKFLGPRTWGAFSLPPSASLFDDTVRAGKVRARLDQLPLLAKTAVAETLKHDNVITLLYLTVHATNGYTEATQPIVDSPIETSAGPAQQAALATWHLSVAELCCGLVACSVRTKDQQAQLLSQGDATEAALKSLIRLASSGHAKAEEAALDAISAVIHDLPEAALALEQAADWATSVLWLFVQKLESRSTSLQLSAARCATHFFVATMSAGKQRSLAGGRTILSVILRLISELHDSQAISTLAFLVSSGESLQCLAVETGALRVLAQYLSSVTYGEDEIMDMSQGESLLGQECALLSIARLSADRDDLRRRVSDEHLLPLIIRYLRAPATTLRVAACECIKALSRSANVLRTGLVEAGAADPLVERLFDAEDDRVRIVALAAVNNLVSDFSPMKEILLLKGTVPRLVEITKTTSGPLRLNSLMALVNMVYWSESPLKRKVMDALTWDYLVVLMQDADTEVQEQAICLLRNLAMNTESDIAMVVSGIGEERLYRLLEEKLHSSHEGVVHQAIYALVNIATGNEFQKMPILHRPRITRGLLAHLARLAPFRLRACALYSEQGHPNQDIRVGAVWCIHNLARGVHDNVTRMRSLGFESRLRDLADDMSLDVRERVSETLHVFNST